MPRNMPSPFFFFFLQSTQSNQFHGKPRSTCMPEYTCTYAALVMGPSSLTVAMCHAFTAYDDGHETVTRHRSDNAASPL